jgi:hypothetical protein
MAPQQNLTFFARFKTGARTNVFVPPHKKTDEITMIAGPTPIKPDIFRKFGMFDKTSLIARPRNDSK